MYVRQLWKLAWDVQVDNRLYSLRPHVGTNILPCLTRRDEVVLTRLCVGHTFLTHCFLFTDIRTSTGVYTMSVSIDRESLTRILCRYGIAQRFIL